MATADSLFDYVKPKCKVKTFLIIETLFRTYNNKYFVARHPTMSHVLVIELNIVPFSTR